jgi:large subunit ribosomal protein L21
MKYAVIKTGGKQHKVIVGQTLNVEKLDNDGKTYEFNEVLLVVDGDKVEMGMPTISGMTVYAEVIAEVKGEKIEVFKYKSKSRYRKHTGHRQKYTQVKVTGIGEKPAAAKAIKAEVKAAPKAEKVAKVAAKKPAAKKATAKKAAK